MYSTDIVIIFCVVSFMGGWMFHLAADVIMTDIIEKEIKEMGEKK